MRNLKKFLALVLALMMVVSVMVTVSATSFKDDAKISAKYEEAVEVLAGLKVLQGNVSGNLMPQQEIKRSEMAAIAYRITTGDPTTTNPGVYTGSRFSDVPSNHWAYGFINWCADGGLLAGYPDGTFKPDDTITGYDVITILLRALGYGKADELTGAGYETNAATRAQELGIINNIGLANLRKPATREMVAEMTFQTLRQFTVSYSVLSNYTKNAHTLGWNVFKLAEGTDVPDTFGRPCHTWSSNGKTVAAIPYEAEASYTTAVSECDMVVDLGEKGDVSVADVYVNGHKYANDAYNSAEHFLGGNDTTGTLKATATAALVGAQGRLTEVYYYGNAYHVVMIDQFLAQVKDVKARTFDAAGHVKTPASIKLEAYDGDSKTLTQDNYYADYTYTKDQHVLIYGVTNAAWGETLNASNHDFEIVAAAPLAATAKQTAYDVQKETSTIGGTVYDWAQQYHLVKHGTNGTTYNVYTDTYGNLLGLTVPSSASYYGIIEAVAWRDSEDDLFTAYARANLVMADAAKNTGVTLSSVKYGGTVKAFTGAGSDAYGDLTTGAVSSTAQNNNGRGTKAGGANNEMGYYRTLYKFSQAANGAYAIEEIGAAIPNVDIKNTVANKFGSSFTTDDTVYLVETTGADGKPVYQAYAGYRSVPSMEDVAVSYLVDGKEVTYVYVDARNAVIPGTINLVYFDGVCSETDYDANTNGIYQYWVNANGTDTLIGVAGGKKWVDVDVETQMGGYLYEITVDASGNITNAARVNWTNLNDGTRLVGSYYLTKEISFGAKGSTIVSYTGKDGQIFNCADTEYFQISGTSIKPSSADELKGVAENNTGYYVWMVLSDAVTVETIYYTPGT